MALLETIIKKPDVFLESLFRAATCSADPKNCLPPQLKNIINAPPKGKVVVIGAGKAAGSMANAFENFWLKSFPATPLYGIVVTRYGHTLNCKHIDVIEAGHPLPDANGTSAANKIFELARGLTKDDLAVCLISGGCSALLSLPADGIELEEKRSLTQELLHSGATIHEMNCVRKHLSKIKGGKLAKAIYPAKVLTFCISDVPGDELHTIGSGPTVPDPTQLKDAVNIIKKYQMSPSEKILQHLSNPENETPKTDDPVFRNTQISLIATPQLALQAAVNQANKFGINALVLGDAIEGEAREVARVHAAITSQVLRHNQPAPAPVVLLSGGETTVKVKGTGRGGRNTEFLLAFAITLFERSKQHLPRVSAIACDTDGIDGTEDNAGALYLPTTFQRARNQDINLVKALYENDGYTVFQDLGDLVITGPTLTNVNDFRAILIQ